MIRSRSCLLFFVAFALWIVSRSFGAAPFEEKLYGFPGTIPVPGDYDGDEKEDMAIYYPPTGWWHIFKSGSGEYSKQFGSVNMTPVPGDYDGDGICDIAVFDPAPAIWHIIHSGDQSQEHTQYGTSDMMPVPADYDGDGRHDIGVYYPPLGQWYIFKSTEGAYYKQFGNINMTPVPADYDGDGKADLAVYDRTTFLWHFLKSTEGYTNVLWGYPGPVPVSEDFDGDGLSDLGLFNASSRVFHTFQSTRGAYDITFPETGYPCPADFENSGENQLVVFKDGSGTWYIDKTFIDWDLDGLKRDWENAHGLNDYDNGFGDINNGAEGDPDGDGYNNAYEQAGGSDPQNAASVPSPSYVLYAAAASFQDAIDAVDEYGVILAMPGTYMGSWNRNTTFNGKKVMIRSQAGPEQTIINLENAGRGFIFDDEETRQSVLHGFTIKNGQADKGGGIYCLKSSPTIVDCVIEDCTATVSGGGIYLEGSSPAIKDCTIQRNQTGTGEGGGICVVPVETRISTTPLLYTLEGSSPLIEGCAIRANTSGGDEGGGLFIKHGLWQDSVIESETPSEPQVVRCAITENIGDQAVYSGSRSQTTLKNCAVYKNAGKGVRNFYGRLTVRNCSVSDNAGLDGGAGIASVLDDSIYSLADLTSVENSVVWDNAPAQDQVMSYVDAGVCRVDYSVYNPAHEPSAPNHSVFEATCSTADPKLTRTGHLRSVSPAKDGADDSIAPSDDLDGEVRPAGVHADIGCDEFIDTDGDTLADIWEAENGLNPAVYDDPQANPDGDELTHEQEYTAGTDPFVYPGDSDDDGLSDDAEAYHGSDPLDWDSDGDLFPDGWEVDYDFDPMSTSDPNPSGDADGDSLSNFEELRHGTDPTAVDSDGDGVQDGAEVSNGSDPADADDNGDPDNCLVLNLVVGDPSTSNSERYSLDVGEHVKHVASEFGVVTPATPYAFVKGKVYTYRVRWIASIWETPDYDYRATIGGQRDGVPQAGILTGPGFILNDSDALLGEPDWSGGSVDTTAGKSGTLSVLKIDSVEAYCDKFGASGSFGVNPEIFAGGQTDFGQPDQPPPYWWLPGTYANPSSKVLKVFFKYIKDSNDEPDPFDIDLKANILPDSISDDVLNITWYNWAGPSASGSFDKTDEREVKFQNPTKGGLYKFRMEMQPPGCIMASDAWVLLPKAGGEIAGWMVTEVPSLVTRAANWETAVRAVAVAHSLNENDFLETAWKAIATCDFDYQGIVGSPTKRYSFRDSDRPAGHTPDPSIPGMAGEKGNGDWDEPSYATLAGIVVHRAKINNAMYAVWGRELGYTELQLKAGAFWNAMGRSLWDDSTSQSAVELGSDLYDAHSGGGSLSAILTKTRARDIQSPDTPSGLNDVNLWPDTTSVSSGFSLPTMPTDYDSLDEGENEIPRGRLF